ncbi:MAG: ABC transporter permease [Oscillospiraceae bacterium]|jgi:oligopeptide transport system permease protein|nr:ABC transporter permease [Oscillospiraceae bacterium]
MQSGPISDELFRPSVKNKEELEHISRPNLTAFQDGWLRLSKNKGSVCSLILLILLVILALAGPHLTQFTYYGTDYNATYQAPSMLHWFGTDKFGRDQWARVWYGTRISLLIAVVAAALDLIVGVSYGAVSALFGGKVDAVMQRFIEILVGIPNLIFVILLMMLMPASVWTLILAMSISGWVNMARLVRAEILKLKNQEFVLAARVLGTSDRDIIRKHMIPNTIGVIVINTMFTIPSAIFTEAFLSFIGIGLQEPKASLGVLINSGFQVINSHVYLLLIPAAVIVLIMVCFSILGDGMRDAFDPRMRN